MTTTTETNAGALTPPDLSQDIPHATAQAAHAGTSFVPEERAAGVIREWVALMGAKWAKFAALATTPEAREKFAGMWDAYHAGAKRRYLDHLHARSRCLSAMITGPANFPTERNKKRYATADKRWEEFAAHEKRWEAAFYREFSPGARPIMSGDADAVERLADKIEELEAEQERMKDANAAIRAVMKNKDATKADAVAALLDLGFADADAGKLMSDRTHYINGCFGYAACTITNNGANILRLKKRLAHLEKTKARPITEIDAENARIEDNPPENRIRLFFPGKPDAATIAELKKNGFRWTPSLGCWQAYRNEWSLRTARTIAGARKTPESAAA